MTQEIAALLFALLAVVGLALMAWGWRRRARRDAAVVAPVGPVRGAIRASFEGLYVATTRHCEPLERLNVQPLSFRSRVSVSVTDEGVALDLPGAPTVFIASERLRGAGRATWTIDRVVDGDGLVLLAWAPDDDTVCDTYVRLQDADPDALVAEILPLLTSHDSTQMGAQR
ncbi:PH-like domain-containing protein [Microbacterium stercoris]|uniref:PH domain-containing protein n=1 Tax=Microbacterium stercoris TaxID=2820289 RepID=A0A939QT92_9MICO|nr:hypothetical protein [Microbacterium stercoris]MBO3664256.1 hypothetical protein [Microbacterium stercoris]